MNTMQESEIYELISIAPDRRVLRAVRAEVNANHSTPREEVKQMDARDFIKKGRRTPFAKWDELGKCCEGVVLWTKVVQLYEYNSRVPKLDEAGEQLMQMLICIQTEDGKLIVPVREESDLHEKLSDEVAKVEAESVEPGGYLSVRWVDERPSKAKIFEVKYELPPTGNGDSSDSQAAF